MTLRPETVRERLALARGNLEVLGLAAAIPRERFLADRKVSLRDLRDAPLARQPFLERGGQWAAAYGLQITAQALLDAGAHILSGRFKEAPKEYGEIVPELTSHGVLDPELGERLAKVSGFRNVLMHEYGIVDYALVHEKLQQLGDLVAFAAALEEWLTREGL
jgi:uncharacterized protein YutE (UPF0331/DUF86 family)